MSKLTEMLDKYRKSGNVKLKVGIMGDKTYPDGTKAAMVGYVNEYGAPADSEDQIIPARPFFRTAIENNSRVLPEMVASLLKKHDPETVARLVGEHMVGQFSDSVQTWTEPSNADSTIRQKGYNAPLRANDRILRNSFSYEIEE